MGEGGVGGMEFYYGMNKSWGKKVQHRDYSQWYCNSVCSQRWQLHFW